VLRRARLISGLHSKGKRETDTNCNKENYDLLLGIIISHRKGSEALEKIGKRGCEISMTEDI